VSNSARRALPFIGVGIAFVAIGATGRVAFIYAGIAFMCVGIIRAKFRP
jgi:hypothetical protein